MHTQRSLERSDVLEIVPVTKQHPVVGIDDDQIAGPSGSVLLGDLQLTASIDLDPDETIDQFFDLFILGQ